MKYYTLTSDKFQPDHKKLLVQFGEKPYIYAEFSLGELKAKSIVEFDKLPPIERYKRYSAVMEGE